MKRIFIIIVSLIISLTLISLAAVAKGGSRGGGSKSTSGHSGQSKGGTTRVKGYTKKKSGTYVAPHQRTSPDKSKTNNWSSKGNVNPYTGKEGTRDPYK